MVVSGWRRAFCTSIPKDHQPKIATEKTSSTPTPRSFSSKFSFFSSSSSTSNTPTPSNPSTPRPQTPLSLSETTPTLRCRTSKSTTTTLPATTSNTPTKSKSNSPRSLVYTKSSTPSSSPRSPSTFSLLLKTSLRLSSKPSSRCGICAHSIKPGSGTAIFTAECSHAFHLPCLATSSSTSSSKVTCPVCDSPWKDPPLILVTSQPKSQPSDPTLRLYDDDEPLMSPVSGIRFNPIPESEDEYQLTESDSEFPGFFSDPATPRVGSLSFKGINSTLSPHAAVVAVGRSYETYAVLLKIKAPPLPSGSRRPSVDLVAVVDAGENMTPQKLHSLKRAMRALILSLSSNDRLSIVGFSSGSKRMLPLRRMTASGRRSARRIIDALGISPGTCANDALRKAAKVLQDRKEKNHFSSIILLNGQDDDLNRINQSRRFEHVSSTRFSHLEIPVHSFRVGEELYEDMFVKCVNGFLSVVVLDLKLVLGLGSGSGSNLGEIVAVYSCTGRPGLLSRGLAKLGDLYSEEEREILIELKVPAAVIGSTHFVSVKSSYNDPGTKQPVFSRDQLLLVPRPHGMRSSDTNVLRLRSLFVMTRAVAESRRLLAEKNDLVSAERLLSSARAVLGQPSLRLVGVEEYKKRVEAELAEVRWRKQSGGQQQLAVQASGRRRKEKERREKDVSISVGGGRCCVDEKGEPLTPTSAWKAAERLAKVAIMRKSLNRVSDLHGFEDARF